MVRALGAHCLAGVGFCLSEVSQLPAMVQLLRVRYKAELIECQWNSGLQPVLYTRFLTGELSLGVQCRRLRGSRREPLLMVKFPEKGHTPLGISSIGRTWRGGLGKVLHCTSK